MNILLTKKYFDDDLAYMQSGFVSDDIKFIDPKTYNEEAIVDALNKDEIDVLLGDFFTANVLSNAKHLKAIQVPWTGVDRVNFALLDEYNVTICNSHSNSAIVAEHAVGLMLAILRMLPYHDAEMRKGNWARPKQGTTEGFYPPVTLMNQNVGFIGFGAIAKHIKQLLAGFNCKYYAIVNTPEKHQDAGFEWIGTPEQKTELAQKAKIIFVAAALTPQTTGIVDAEFLTALGADGFLVNVSRGQLLDEEAIYNALKNNVISRAALDTWYDYPKPGQEVNYPSKFNFHELNNLVLSPHRAGFLKDKMPHLDDAVENINNMYLGKELINVINKSKSY